MFSFLLCDFILAIMLILVLVSDIFRCIVLLRKEVIGICIISSFSVLIWLAICLKFFSNIYLILEQQLLIILRKSVEHPLRPACWNMHDLMLIWVQYDGNEMNHRLVETIDFIHLDFMLSKIFGSSFGYQWWIFPVKKWHSEVWSWQFETTHYWLSTITWHF